MINLSTKNESQKFIDVIFRHENKDPTEPEMISTEIVEVPPLARETLEIEGTIEGMTGEMIEGTETAIETIEGIEDNKDFETTGALLID